MDASIVDTTRLSGYYGLIPLGEMFAKMDAKTVKINICREDTAERDRLNLHTIQGPAGGPIHVPNPLFHGRRNNWVQRVRGRGL
jgi:hypothetical protein